MVSMPVSASEAPLDHDQRVILRNMSWKDFEVFLALRGDRAGVRAYYLEGEIELMSPSGGHESLKKIASRLLEAWADEKGLEFNGYGSWTLKTDPKEAAAEPDECYVMGATSKPVPDLAIEVIWTRGGLQKLAIYERLGVHEVWMIERDKRIQLYVLRESGYETKGSSELLPDLDIAWLASFLANESQSQAVRAMRAARRAK